MIANICPATFNTKYTTTKYSDSDTTKESDSDSDSEKYYETMVNAALDRLNITSNSDSDSDSDIKKKNNVAVLVHWFDFSPEGVEEVIEVSL